MKYLWIYISTLVLLSSCFSEKEYNNTKKDNFEALWTILDEHYCFFEYKGVDWDDIHEKYSQKIDETLSNSDFFDILSEMLSELKDGHVNLIATHNMSRYWKWFEDYPDNFDEKIQRNYIGTDYNIAGGLRYKILENNIGYIYCGSFSNGFSNSNLSQALGRMADCEGLIIDVRHNGGGMLSYAERFASRFFEEKTLVGYIRHKSGKGHNDFSKPYERHIKPYEGIRYQKKTVILTNRRSYSATNDFVNAMSYSANVTIIGDQTGGGSGLPFSSELPNGWLVRFSTSPMLNADMEHIEFGLKPDKKVQMTEEDIRNGIDTILEAAFEYILQD